MKQEELEKNLDRVHAWIRSADQKISIFLAFQAFMLNFTLSLIFSLLKSPGYQFHFSLFSFFLTFLGALLIGFGIITAIFALLPRLNDGGNKKSLIYFKGIASLKIEDYKKAINSMTAQSYKEALQDQIYISSKIATIKHNEFKYALISFMSGIILLLSSVIFFAI